MGKNAPELPHFDAIVILLLDLVEDLIVGKDLLILIVINGADELETIRMAVKFSVLLFNGLDNAGTEPLTVLLWTKQESATNKV